MRPGTNAGRLSEGNRFSQIYLRQPRTAQERCVPARMGDGLQPPRIIKFFQANEVLRRDNLPSPGDRSPPGPNWVHEIKHDGYRLMARRDPIGTRLITREGTTGRRAIR